jgi:hypothetical protein
VPGQVGVLAEEEVQQPRAGDLRQPRHAHAHDAVPGALRQDLVRVESLSEANACGRVKQGGGSVTWCAQGR